MIGNLIGTDADGRVRPGQRLPGRARRRGRSASRSRGMAPARRSSRATTWGSSITDAATGALIEGTFIGTDKTGTIAAAQRPAGHPDRQGTLGQHDRRHGRRREQNLISANHWGIEIDGGPPSGPSANLVTGQPHRHRHHRAVAAGQRDRRRRRSRPRRATRSAASAPARGTRSRSTPTTASTSSRAMPTRSSPTRSSPTARSASSWTARPTTPSPPPTITAALPDTALSLDRDRRDPTPARPVRPT